MFVRLAILLILLRFAPKALKRILDTVVLVRRLTFDARVPLLLKALVPMALLYAVLPIGLIPDFLPVVGYLDDIVVLVLAAWILVTFSRIFFRSPSISDAFDYINQIIIFY